MTAFDPKRSINELIAHWVFERRSSLGNRVKKIILLLVLSASANATDLFLEFEEQCSASNSGLDFNCKNSSKPRHLLINENGKWYGKNPESGDVWELGMVKADNYIVVLDNPVFFSGKSTIHLMRANSKFYWTEVAYSEILKASEITIWYGSIRVVNK